MEISFNTPALLFPAITFLMLVYSNRFLALSNLIRTLHDRYSKEVESRPNTIRQIKNLRTRLTMIRWMQALAVASFLLCLICMYLIFTNRQEFAHILFAISMILLMSSMVLSILEIQISTKALEHELSDMEEELGNSNVIVDYFKTTFDKQD
jgi:ABC-type polysaccharide/polyol phosphate export permease